MVFPTDNRHKLGKRMPPKMYVGIMLFIRFPNFRVLRYYQ